MGFLSDLMRQGVSLQALGGPAPSTNAAPSPAPALAETTSSPGMPSADMAALRGNDGYGASMDGFETGQFDKDLQRSADAERSAQLAAIQRMTEGQKRAPIRLNQQEVRIGADGQLEIVSSKAKKNAAGASAAQAALARGVAGTDPIDTNGTQLLATQELAKRLERAKAELAQLQGNTTEKD